MLLCAARSCVLHPCRYSTYWAVYGTEGDRAREIIEHRKAVRIPIDSADAFLSTVQQFVKSLDQVSRPHPLSTEAAVASLKRYISEHRYRVQLADLIDTTVDRIIEVTSDDAYSVSGSSEVTTASATARVRGYEAACATLLAMAPIGGYWAEVDHLHIWQKALLRLSPVGGNGLSLWIELKRYPGTLLLYALGLGAVAADRLEFLAGLLSTPIHREQRDDRPAVELLPPFCMFESGGGQVARILEGMERRHAPLNDWIHDLLRGSGQAIDSERRRVHE